MHCTSHHQKGSRILHAGCGGDYLGKGSAGQLLSVKLCLIRDYWGACKACSRTRLKLCPRHLSSSRIHTCIYVSAIS
jgi:hypothetical protein